MGWKSHARANGWGGRADTSIGKPGGATTAPGTLAKDPCLRNARHSHAGDSRRTSVLPWLLSANYMPHRYCYLAQPGLIWINVMTDGLIAASYVLIFACLFWIVGRLRMIPEVQGYLWVFVSFGIFIVACASTHVMEVVTIWWPVYRISAAFKVVCAAASVTTAALFTKAAPGITTGIRQFLDALATSQGEHASGVLEYIRVRGQVERLKRGCRRSWIVSLTASLPSTQPGSLFPLIPPR